jgi:hypothetical protein
MMRLQSISIYTLAIVISATACTNTEQNDLFRETFESLPSGTPLSVEVSYPHDGDVFPEGEGISVHGFATVGAASAANDTALVFVADVSGSTDNPASCGGDRNDDGEYDTVLDCEIEALLGVRQAALSLGNIPTIGTAVFASKGAAADMQPGGSDADLLTQLDADLDFDAISDVDEVLRSMQYGGIDQFTPRNVALGTSYGAGLEAALAVLEASEESHKMVIMVSDGDNNTAPNVAEVLPDLPPGTTVHTFAIGDWASCIKNAKGLGSLHDIASATGGSCTEVPNVADLPDVLPEIIQAQLTGLELRVDGELVTIDNMDPQLPEDGPVTINYSTTLWGLPPGEHEICATALGLDSIGTADVTECVTIIINSPPAVECSDLVVAADANCQSTAEVGAASLDPDGDFVDCVIEPEGPYPLGTTAVTMTCTDDWGAVSACEAVVEVVDDTPVEFEMQTLELWPPNHKYHTISLADCIGEVQDNCSDFQVANLGGYAQLKSVTSDELEEGLGDGKTCADSIMILDDHEFQVRAERSGDRDGRVYTAKYELTNVFGYVSEHTCAIVVPHSPGNPAVDNGAAMCVGESCEEIAATEQCGKGK